jgi:hypothetical protein
MKQARHRKTNPVCSYLHVEARKVALIQTKNRIVWLLDPREGLGEEDG